MPGERGRRSLAYKRASVEISAVTGAIRTPPDVNELS